MRELLDGKKTYIVACGVVLGAVAGVMTGELTVMEALVIAGNGLGLGTLRAGVKKGTGR